MTPDVKTRKFQTYLVHGENWIAEVKEHEGDSNWSVDDRMIEAASRAIEAFQGEKIHPIIFTVEPGVKELVLGPSVLVHRKQAHPNKGKYFPSYELLANGGYYKDSFRLKGVWDILVEELMKIGDFDKPSEVTAHDVVLQYRKKFPKKSSEGLDESTSNV
jgi:hypothetical protein